MNDLDYIGLKGTYKGYLVECEGVTRKGALIIKRFLGGDGALKTVPKSCVVFPTTPTASHVQAALAIGEGE